MYCSFLATHVAHSQFRRTQPRLASRGEEEEQSHLACARFLSSSKVAQYLYGAPRPKNRTKETSEREQDDFISEDAQLSLVNTARSHQTRPEPAAQPRLQPHASATATPRPARPPTSPLPSPPPGPRLPLRPTPWPSPSRAHCASASSAARTAPWTTSTRASSAATRRRVREENPRSTWSSVAATSRCVRPSSSRASGTAEC